MGFFEREQISHLSSNLVTLHGNQRLTTTSDMGGFAAHRVTTQSKQLNGKASSKQFHTIKLPQPNFKE